MHREGAAGLEEEKKVEVQRGSWEGNVQEGRGGKG